MNVYLSWPKGVVEYITNQAREYLATVPTIERRFDFEATMDALAIIRPLKNLASRVDAPGTDAAYDILRSIVRRFEDEIRATLTGR